jgi:staphylococcal nuclease domain-containing protein 1
MGRRAAPESVVEPEVPVDNNNGDVPAEPRAPLTSAQRLAVSASAAETSSDPFGPDAKYFTEMRVLHREVSNNHLQVILLLHLRFV